LRAWVAALIDAVCHHELIGIHALVIIARRNANDIEEQKRRTDVRSARLWFAVVDDHTNGPFIPKKQAFRLIKASMAGPRAQWGWPATMPRCPRLTPVIVKLID